MGFTAALARVSALLVGLAAVELLLVIWPSSKSLARSKSYRFAFTGALWLVEFDLLAVPALQLQVTSGAQPLAIGFLALSSLLGLLLALAKFAGSAGGSDGRPSPYYWLAWLAWLLENVLALRVLGHIYPALVVTAGTAVESLGLVFVLNRRLDIASRINIWKASGVLISLTIVAALLGLANYRILSSNLDLSHSSRPVITTVGLKAKSEHELNTLSAGLVTTGLGQTDRVIQLDFKGILAVSKPNFFQVVHLTLRGHISNSNSQLVLFRASGVPQPGGSLRERTSRITIRSANPAITAFGKATAILAESAFGQLQLNRHPYSYLLSYEPIGMHLVTGTIDLWPRSPKTGVSSLE
ncbi:hypothetical protein [Ferrimicrobium sp.]|uniref:hypothetical protein n=1 Tax=Ferrimicrobium sp. TaxID=2926050 RepID=UPI0027E5A70B|nr:hypothetical protein [Ferrimicrobium sp.]